MSTILRLQDGAMFDRIPSTNAVPQAPFKRLKRAGKGERPFVQGNMSITRSKHQQNLIPKVVLVQSILR
jgi:hypothetical protein